MVSNGKLEDIRFSILTSIFNSGEAKIWQLQIHPAKTPLAPYVDFRRLAEQYVVSGGDIKNAVIKALYSSLGFSAVDQPTTRNDVTRWYLNIADYIRRDTHIVRAGAAG